VQHHLNRILAKTQAENQSSLQIERYLHEGHEKDQPDVAEAKGGEDKNLKDSPIWRSKSHSGTAFITEDKTVRVVKSCSLYYIFMES